MTNSNETSFDTDDQEPVREKLLWNVKREVKQMMEEAVMKKCIHEENCSITTLSAAVEACLQHGLKRRAVGLFKTSTTTALLQKIAKTCPPAGEVVKMIDEHHRYNDESMHLFNLPRKLSSITQTSNAALTEENRRRTTSLAVHNRYLWIRTALINRSLHKIVEYIVENSSKYYEPYALVCNSVQGPILSSLLVGPCALEFTRVKTSDHLWTDPHADELVQRHRMHSQHRTTVNANNAHSRKFRPSLQINLKRNASSSMEETQRNLTTTSANPARDYVESLHQNAKSQLIYGKNNVLVQPIPGYDPIPGYLSLHHYQYGLILKWTPNQLMNGYSESAKGSKGNSQGTSESDTNNNNTDSPKKVSVYWDYAISINMSSIVYLHCHQYNDGDRIVFIGRDGVQYPPFHIKDKGGHLLAFLTCLESGLAPLGQLDPPLWYEQSQGKTLPKLSRRTEYQSYQSTSNTSVDEETSNGLNQSDKADGEMSPPTGDYVFRIVFQTDHDTIPASPNSRWQWPLNDINSYSQSSQSSLSPPVSQSVNVNAFAPVPSPDPSGTSSDTNGSPTTTNTQNNTISVRTSIESLCETMRRQILSRAFFGWLTYCRHLKTARTHLTSLVNPISKTTIEEEFDPSLSLTANAWTELFLSKQKENLPVDRKEIYRRLYVGGCEPSIRKQVWPFLFSHYSFESTIEERDEIDRKTIERYNTLNNEWRSAETIVTQIDIQNATNRKSSLKKLFSTTPGPAPSSAETALAALRNALASIPEKFAITSSNTLERKDSITSNEVFYDETVHTVTIPIAEESSCATTPSRERPFLSTSSNQSVLVARTRTQSLIDRASPYNVIETSTEMEQEIDDETHLRPIQDDEEVDDVLMTTDEEAPLPPSTSHPTTTASTAPEETISPSSSLTSGTDVYMDAVDILNDDQQNNQSDGSLTPICYGPFGKEIIDSFAANLHRIDKDVARCDRTYSYFTNINNLKKLRNIMCTYVWDNLNTGYIQGMCDLVAPFLVAFDEEVIAYSCFCYLMKRLLPNFPHGAGMDEHLAHMRSLLQILDFELYEHIHRTGDFTHFYFCYRWFLLDFKREFVYDDIFLVWETIAAARRTVSKRFVLFIALAMLKSYRDIILDNRMDFTDIIRFFNEMAERHDAREILRVARELVLELQNLIDNK